MRDVLIAFVVSRAVIWTAGTLVAAIHGVHGSLAALRDPIGYASPFASDLLNTVFAPAASFDSAWLLEVATTGYANASAAAFYPLYPGLVAALGDVIGSNLIAGLAISTVTSVAGLYLVHRLTALDFGADVARKTVWIMACFPMAFTFSAVYTEGLFLLLSVASIYAARLGRWNYAAAAAFLAAITRSSGILLLVPLALLYLYGPRADRAPDRAAGIRPHYRIRVGSSMVLAAPLGVLAFALYLGLDTGDPLASFAAQENWGRVLAPLAGLFLGVLAGGQGLIDLLAGTHLQQHVIDARAMGGMNLALLAFMVGFLWLAVEAVRRLPAAYAGYAIVSLALPLSTPAAGQPLMSLPRFAMVAFPLWIALALWAEDARTHRRLIAASLGLLAVGSGLFVAWIAAP